MAFDAGMMRAAVWEINQMAKDARVEKIQQPQKDEIVITLHSAAWLYRRSQGKPCGGADAVHAAA